MCRYFLHSEVNKPSNYQWKPCKIKKALVKMLQNGEVRAKQ